MKLNLFFDNTTLTTNITKDISIKNLIYEIKENPKTKDFFKNNSLSFFNKDFKILKESDIISANKEEEQNIYISSIKQISKETEILQPLDELLMLATNAKTKSKIAVNKRNISNLAFEQLMESALTNLSNTGSTTVNIRANQLSQLQNLLRTMINPDSGEVFINPVPSNNQNVVVNEQSVSHLIEMGFSDADSRRALRMARNNVNRATDILINGTLDYMPSEQ